MVESEKHVEDNNESQEELYDYLDSSEKKELDKTNSIAKQVDS